MDLQTLKKMTDGIGFKSKAALAHFISLSDKISEVLSSLEKLNPVRCDPGE